MAPSSRQRLIRSHVRNFLVKVAFGLGADEGGGPDDQACGGMGAVQLLRACGFPDRFRSVQGRVHSGGSRV